MTAERSVHFRMQASVAWQQQGPKQRHRLRMACAEVQAHDYANSANLGAFAGSGESARLHHNLRLQHQKKMYQATEQAREWRPSGAQLQQRLCEICQLLRINTLRFVDRGRDQTRDKVQMSSSLKLSVQTNAAPFAHSFSIAKYGEVLGNIAVHT